MLIIVSKYQYLIGKKLYKFRLIRFSYVTLHLTSKAQMRLPSWKDLLHSNISFYFDSLGMDTCWFLHAMYFAYFIAWVKVFRINPEFRILTLTFHRKSAS